MRANALHVWEHQRILDLSNFITFAIPLIFIGLTIYIANRDDLIGQRSSLLYGIWLTILSGCALAGSSIFSVLMGITDNPETQQVDTFQVLVSIVAILFLLTAGFMLATSSDKGLVLKRWIGQTGTYNPSSNVHQTAVILALALMIITLIEIPLSGGTQGIAESYAERGVSFAEVIFNQVIYLFFTLMGIGLFFRRTLQQAVQRLGLRWPTFQDIMIGGGVGFLMVLMVYAFNLVFVQVVPSETYESQSAASEALTGVFSTIQLAFLGSVLISIGEEIFFRGAVTPVFGNVFTSIFFVLLHVQYAFSPSVLILFIVSLAFGHLRLKYSTTAAIVAHFVYNFTQLALAIFVAQMLAGS